MRVNFVTQWYPPEPAGPAYAPAIGLTQRGHEVNVLTGFPNYPTGRIYDGYSLKPYSRERGTDGITVHRVPIYPSHDANAVKRMGNYLSFATSASVAGQFLPPADVWLTYSSPATAALPRMLQRPGRRAPHFMIIQDLWPDSVTESGFTGGTAARAIHTTLDAFCKLSYRDASGIGIISRGMRDVLTERGVPDAKIFDTPNWVENRPLPEKPRTRADLGLPASGRLFLYAGNLGELQALDDLVDAFSGAAAHLVLMGSGIKLGDLERRLASSPQSNIHLLPPVAAHEVAEYYERADVVIVSLVDTPLLRVTMPSKVQASLAAGRPILAHAAGDAAQVVREADAGVAVTPGDAAATRAAINRLAALDDAALARLGANGRRYFDSNFSATAGLDRLEAALLAISTKDNT
ncbi:colanic acid biosynthesis glycosyl transferase WcaI [Dermacoccus sp. GAS27A]